MNNGALVFTVNSRTCLCSAHAGTCSELVYAWDRKCVCAYKVLHSKFMHAAMVSSAYCTCIKYRQSAAFHSYFVLRKKNHVALNMTQWLLLALKVKVIQRQYYASWNIYSIVKAGAFFNPFPRSWSVCVNANGVSGECHSSGERCKHTVLDECVRACLWAWQVFASSSKLLEEHFVL